MHSNCALTSAQRLCIMKIVGRAVRLAQKAAAQPCQQGKRMNIFRFEANTPVQGALKYDGGRDVDGPYGPQVLRTLANGRLMYLEREAARRIDELKITAREPFSMCKREARNGQKRAVEWEVNRLEPVLATARLEIVPPGGGNEPGAAKSTQRAAKIEPGRAAQPTVRAAVTPAFNKPEPDVNGGAATTLETQLRASIPGIAKLEYALKTAIAAAAGAEQFGHAISYAVRFAPQDIRAMAITVFGETRKQS
jgi:hypothetical protein